jgi:FAD:protein FMN transferase
VSVHVFDTMGTVASLRFPRGGVRVDTLSRIERTFRGYDRRFSLYDAASELSRLARAELTLTAASREVRRAYARAVDWRNRTAGAFTPHRPDGVVDLSGVVKALAISDAGELLDLDCADWLLAVGGDVLARGRYEEAAWRVGIVDPAARDRLAGVVELAGPRRAVTTSGTTERGQHLWRRNAEAFVQVTVSADDIETADVLATAIAAGDGEDLDRITAEFDIDVLTFDVAGRARATPGARGWLSQVERPGAAARSILELSE